MSNVLLGLFTNSIEIFGIVISVLLIIIGFIVVFVVRNAINKVKQLEQFHDDIISVRLEMEGRKSFTETITKHDHDINELFRLKADMLDYLRRIDARCERRLEQAMYVEKDGKPIK